MFSDFCHLQHYITLDEKRNSNRNSFKNSCAIWIRKVCNICKILEIELREREKEKNRFNFDPLLNSIFRTCCCCCRRQGASFWRSCCWCWPSSVGSKKHFVRLRCGAAAAAAAPAFWSGIASFSSALKFCFSHSVSRCRPFKAITAAVVVVYYTNIAGLYHMYT